MAAEKQSRNESELSMFVLDVLRYDIEQIDSIIKLLNDSGCIGWRHCWPRDFAVPEVVSELKSLVRKRLVDVYESNSDESELVAVDWGEIDVDAHATEYWYLLTDRGRKVWDSWEPPLEK